MNTILTNNEIDAAWDGLTPCGHGKSRYDIARAVIAAYEAKLAQQAPVAWVIPGKDKADAKGWIDAKAWEEDEFTQPLYTHPAPQQADRQRVPDEQEVRLLLNRFERQVHRMGELWERCQGKGWPASESDEFAILRDAKTPKTRAALIALLAAAPEAPAQADRQRVPGPTNNYHQLREALISADQAMAESGLLACHAVRIQIRAALGNAAAPEAPAQHPDDVAVDDFAQAMKYKLAYARHKGREGWQTCPPEELSRMLREHVAKGDPLDVANFCMFLWWLGHGIASAQASAQCDGAKSLLMEISGDLQIMMGSAVELHDSKGDVAGYQVMTGALHRIFGHLSAAGVPVSIPSRMKKSALVKGSTGAAPEAPAQVSAVDELAAFEKWYETAACIGIEPIWAAWQARAALEQKGGAA